MTIRTRMILTLGVKLALVSHLNTKRGMGHNTQLSISKKNTGLGSAMLFDCLAIENECDLRRGPMSSGSLLAHLDLYKARDMYTHLQNSQMSLCQSQQCRMRQIKRMSLLRP